MAQTLALTGGSTTLQTISSAGALGNLLLAFPQSNAGYTPQSAPVTPGITPPVNPFSGLLSAGNAFLFNYEGEQTVYLESDITDHYIEDNSAIQDQIALRPELITTHGYVGELTDILPGINQIVQAAIQKLTLVSAFAPAFSVSAQNAINTAILAAEALASLKNSAIGALNTITPSGPNITGSAIFSPAQTNQSQAFQMFYGYWLNRTLFTIQTPWCIFQNTAIKTMRAIQDADTNVITDFEITFKVMRFTNTILGGQIVGQGRYNNAAAGLVSLGNGTPPAGPSLLGQSLLGGK